MSDGKTEDPKQRDMERAHDALREVMKRANEATVQSGQLAARTIILINGGAVVAMLAFVGNFASRAQSSLTSVADSLVYFAIGVAFGAVTLGAAYFANFAGTSALYATDLIRDHPYFQENAGSRRWRVASVVFQVISIVAGIMGLLLFAWGTWEIRNTIKSLA